jgi:hypothetical protein
MLAMACAGSLTDFRCRSWYLIAFWTRRVDAVAGVGARDRNRMMPAASPMVFAGGQAAALVRRFDCSEEERSVY